MSSGALSIRTPGAPSNMARLAFPVLLIFSAACGCALCALDAEEVHRLFACVDEHAFKLGVKFHGFHAQFAAEPRLLIAAEREAGEGGKARVDRDHARADCPGHAV